MTHPAFRPFALLLVLALGSACGEADDPADASAPPEIRVSEVAVLDFTSAEVAPSFEARVFPRPGGGWAVSSRTFGGFVQLLDAGGLPDGQLGKEGSGPGELSGPVFGYPIDDEIWIVDPGSVRLSRFDAGGTFLDSRPLEGRVISVAPDFARPGLIVGGFFGEDRSVLRAGEDPSSDLTGGEIPQADDAQSQASMRQAAGRQWQYAAMPGTDEVWTLSRGEGRVRIHDSTLQVVERFQLPLPDALGGIAWETSFPEGAFPPEVSGLLALDGIVWAVTGIPDSDWHSEMTPGEVGIDGWADTFLSAIDAASREVVATLRLDRVCLPAYGSTLACVDEVGQKITLMELRIE